MSIKERSIVGLRGNVHMY